MYSDPIADFLTRIRNAYALNRSTVAMPGSKHKVEIAEVLKRTGFVKGYETHQDGNKHYLTVELKYGPDGEKLFSLLKRESSPGCRVYKSVADIKPVMNGLGLGVYATSKGVKSDHECREERVGGEHLFTIKI